MNVSYIDLAQQCDAEAIFLMRHYGCTRRDSIIRVLKRMGDEFRAKDREQFALVPRDTDVDDLIVLADRAANM